MRYRHRIKFQQDTSNDEDVDPTYTDFLTGVPCSVVPVTGGEVYRGKQLEATTQFVIETRHYEGVTPQMIAVNELTDVQYTISRIIDRGGRQRRLMIEATELVA